MPRKILYGTNGGDTLQGSRWSDDLYGGPKNGNSAEELGSDILNGFSGHDKLYGFGGADVLSGGDGFDLCYGGDGDDRIIDAEGNDNLHGESGNDVIIAGSGNDFLFGEAGDDKLSGGLDFDILNGGNGKDILLGGGGPDTFIGGGGRDRFVFINLKFEGSRIIDFQDTVDRIVIRDGHSFSELTILRNGTTDVLVVSPTGELQVLGNLPITLTSEDFLFPL